MCLFSADPLFTALVSLTVFVLSTAIVYHHFILPPLFYILTANIVTVSIFTKLSRPDEDWLMIVSSNRNIVDFLISIN